MGIRTRKRTRSQTARFSSNKGAEYERTMCLRLSLWISNRRNRDLFWRSAMSGGRSTIINAAKQHGSVDAHAGDLAATHPDGHRFLACFTVECKSLADFHWHRLVMHSGVSDFEVCWIQTVEQTIEGAEPLGFFKHTRIGEVAVTTKAGYEMLRGNLTDPTNDLIVTAIFPRTSVYPAAYVLITKDVLADVDAEKMLEMYCGPAVPMKRMTKVEGRRRL